VLGREDKGILGKMAMREGSKFKKRSRENNNKYENYEQSVEQ
jgi:hypothetical protein